MPACVIQSAPPASTLLYSVTTVVGGDPRARPWHGLARCARLAAQFQFHFPVEFPAASALSTRVTAAQYSALLEALNVAGQWERRYPPQLVLGFGVVALLILLQPVLLLLGVFQGWGGPVSAAGDLSDYQLFARWWVWLPLVSMVLVMAFQLLTITFCRRRAMWGDGGGARGGDDCAALLSDAVRAAMGAGAEWEQRTAAVRAELQRSIVQ